MSNGLIFIQIHNLNKLKSTYRNSCVFVQDNLEQMRWEYGWRLKFLFLFRNIGILMIRPGRRAGQVYIIWGGRRGGARRESYEWDQKSFPNIFTRVMQPPLINEEHNAAPHDMTVSDRACMEMVCHRSPDMSEHFCESTIRASNTSKSVFFTWMTLLTVPIWLVITGCEETWNNSQVCSEK